MRYVFLSRIQREFNGDSIHNEPLGGTQSAMIYLARELALLGHEVSVFCQGDSAHVDGVFYRQVSQLARFARQNPIDVFVSVADEQVLKLNIPAKATLWWSHNDYCYLWDELPDLRADYAHLLSTRADKLVAVSEWQAHKLSQVFKIPLEHFFITRNGVHWPYFEPAVERNSPVRLIYTSVPDRGLDLLLDFFPLIQAQVPQVELHIYSSFTVWGKSQEWNQVKAGALYAKANAMPQVFLQAPLPHIELVKVLKESSLMVYPNHAALPLDESGFWAETSCISALEAQAAGLPVISSARGALTETIVDQKSGILISGDPYSEAYKNSFIEATVDLLQNPQRLKLMSECARQRVQDKYTWAQIAKEWSDYFGVGFQSTRYREPVLKSVFKSPKISIIIPTYNRARNLKNCLSSLVTQDFKAFEVIVCDDGSDDETREVALSFQAELNLRYRFQDNLGFRAAEARNMGVRLARAKLLVFLDSDLVVPTSFLSAHFEAHQKHSQVVVNSFVYRMQVQDDTDLGLPPAEYIEKHHDKLKPDSRTRYQLFKRRTPIEETYFLDSNAMSILKVDLAKVGGFDGAFVGWGHEDTELGYRLPNYGFKLLLIKDKAIAYHQYHYVSESKDNEMAENWTRLINKHDLESWYHPLWDLAIEGNVSIVGETRLLSRFTQAHWNLKTGDLAPISNLHFQIQVEGDVVTEIIPFKS